MKMSFALLPLAAVVGGIIGAWGPVEELRAYKERPRAERRTIDRARSRGGFDPIAQLINVPDAAKRPRRAKAPPAPSEKAAVASAPAEESASEPMTNAVASADVAAGQDRAKPSRRPMLAPDDLQARIDEASELWRTRIQLARATALEKLGIPEDGAEAFDTALADMNDKLRESMQAMADTLAGEESLTPELGIRLMGDLSATLAETYDQIGGAVDGSKRGEVSSMQLMEFIDPSVAEPLIAVKDKLRGPRARTQEGGE